MSKPALPPPSMTWAGIARGAWSGAAFCASSILYGMAFGLMASGVGLSMPEATLMSALVFSGTAQVAAVQAWSGNPSLIAMVVIVAVANMRYILSGAAARPWLAPLGPAKAALALLPMVDASFAAQSKARAEGDTDAGVMVGNSIVAYSGWVVGTAAGVVAGQLIANPRAWALDFVVVAFCASAVATLFRNRTQIWTVLAAITAVIASETLAPGPWTVVAAGLAGAIVAAVMHKPSPKPFAGRQAV